MVFESVPDLRIETTCKHCGAPIIAFDDPEMGHLVIYNGVPDRMGVLPDGTPTASRHEHNCYKPDEASHDGSE